MHKIYLYSYHDHLSCLIFHEAYWATTAVKISMSLSMSGKVTALHLD